MGNINSYAGPSDNLLTYESIQYLLRVGPSYLEGARCAFTKQELTSVERYLIFTREFLNGTLAACSGNVSQEIGPRKLLALLQGNNFTSTSPAAIYDNAISGTAFETQTFSTLSDCNKRGILALITLNGVLAGATSGTAYTAFLNSAIIDDFKAQSGTGFSLAGYDGFVNGLSKISFIGGFNRSVGKGILLIVTKKTAIRGGPIAQVFPANLQNVGAACFNGSTSDQQSGGLGNPIELGNFYATVSCGCFLSLGCETDVVATENLDVNSMSILNLLGVPLPFRASFNQRTLLRDRFFKYSRRAPRSLRRVNIDESEDDETDEDWDTCSSDSDEASDLVTDSVPTVGIPSIATVSNCYQPNRSKGDDADNLNLKDLQKITGEYLDDEKYSTDNNYSKGENDKKTGKRKENNVKSQTYKGETGKSSKAKSFRVKKQKNAYNDGIPTTMEQLGSMAPETFIPNLGINEPQFGYRSGENQNFGVNEYMNTEQKNKKSRVNFVEEKGCGGCGTCNLCCNDSCESSDDETTGNTYVGTVFQYLGAILQNQIQLKRLLAVRTSRRRLRAIVQQTIASKSTYNINSSFENECDISRVVNNKSVNY